MATAINRFGTTSDMIIQSMEKDGAEVLLAIDDKGLYFTSQNRVDRNMADTNRYAVSRNAVRDYLEKMGLSPVELFEQNKHRIRKSDGEPKKKLNPLKASKRGAK